MRRRESPRRNGLRNHALPSLPRRHGPFRVLLVTWLPVVEREMRVASRRRWTYWGRTAAGLVSLLVMAWYGALRMQLGTGTLGGELFAIASFFTGCLALLTGPLLTADVVASERREGTLGLLFLTDLRGWEVAVGKLAAASLGAIFYLASMIPLLAVSLLLGGVSVTEYTRMAAWLASAMACSLSLGLLASTLSTDARRTGWLCVLFLALAGGLGPLLGGIAWWLLDKQGVTGRELEAWFDQGPGWISIMPAYFHAFDSAYARASAYYDRGMAFTMTVTVGALAWAARRTAILARDEGTRIGQKHAGGWRRWLGALPEAKARLRKRLLDLGPMAWLSARSSGRVGWVWAALGLAVVVDAVVVWVEGFQRVDEALWILTSIPVHLLLKAWMASEAPRQFHEDRRSGAMELLLTTPMTEHEMVSGRFSALLRQFGGPVGAVLAVDALYIGLGLAKISPMGGRVEWLAFWGARSAFLVVDGVALAWMGMWMGVRTMGRHTTAPLLALVLGIPWAGLLAYLLLIASAGDGWFRRLGPTGNIAVAAVGGVVNSLAWAWIGRKGLRGRFREWATRRPGEGRARRG